MITFKEFLKLQEGPTKLAAIELGREFERKHGSGSVKFPGDTPVMYVVKKDHGSASDKLKKGQILTISKSRSSTRLSVQGGNSLSPAQFQDLIKNKIIKKKLLQF